MRVSYFPKYAAKNAAPVLEAFVKGAAYHGITMVENSYNCNAVLIWSQLWAGRMRPNHSVFQHYRAQQLPVIVIDVGLLSRNHTWKISVDGNAYLAGTNHTDERRRQLGLHLQPWRNTGNNILIALQRPDSNQWFNQPSMENWCRNTVNQLQQTTKRPIIIRPHPRFELAGSYPNCSIQTPNRVNGTYDDYDFDTALSQAWAVVNWNSSPGVIAALNGVPAFVGSSSLAAPVCSGTLAEIEQPLRPDREQWVNDLAWTEWTTAEIAGGIPQQYLHSMLSKAAKTTV